MTSITSRQGFMQFVVKPFIAFLFIFPGQTLAETGADSTEQYRHINDNYKKPDVDVWVKRFEREGREVYDFRHELVQAIGLEPGQDVADVGAGTGLFEPLLAHAVGAEGTVYAVDIVPEFIDHIAKKAKQRGFVNIKTVLSREHSIELPAHSVDVVYISDAYHHFVYYQEMLASIYSALRPGGQLFIVEYDKRPGVSREWLIHHIRGTKQQFTAEIEAGGFGLVEEINIPGLKDTFVRRFTKQ
ncbi:MAG: class I SAM-dependent methyltransferase [Gammaproteobacteria bacterium]